jgi:hypothetical protein
MKPMTWIQLIELVALINLAGFVVHLIMGNLGTAFWHALFCLAAAAIRGALPDDEA